MIKLLLSTWLAAISLLSCHKPMDPELRLDPDNPVDLTILESSGDAEEVVRRVKPVVDKMAGPDRSVAAYERTLLRARAACRQDGALHCTFRRAKAGNLAPDIYLDFEITITPGRSGVAQVRLCVLAYGANQSERETCGRHPETSTRTHTGAVEKRMRKEHGQLSNRVSLVQHRSGSVAGARFWHGASHTISSRWWKSFPDKARTSSESCMAIPTIARPVSRSGSMRPVAGGWDTAGRNRRIHRSDRNDIKIASVIPVSSSSKDRKQRWTSA